MKKILFLILNLVFLLNAYSQDILWQKPAGGTDNDYAVSIIETEDGFIIGAKTYSTDGDIQENHGYSDFWIIKTDFDGNITQQITLGGSQNDDANYLGKTNDGGYLFVGSSNSNDGDVSENYGYRDFWIVKLDKNLNLQWEKNYGGSQDDIAKAFIQTDDNGFIIVGETASGDGQITENNGTYDWWIIKIDSVGNLLWQKTLGGSLYDFTFSMLKTPNNEIVIAGASESADGDVPNNYGNTDFWIVKLDLNGNVIWSKNFGGSDYDYPRDIELTNDGNYLIVGYTYSTDGDINNNKGETDFWVIKLDTEGNMIWEKTYGGSYQEGAIDICKTEDNGFIIAGKTNSDDGQVTGWHEGDFNGDRTDDIWIIKIDNDGNLLWQKAFGGSFGDYPWEIKQTSEGDLILVGYTSSNDGDVSGWHEGYSPTGYPTFDAWIVKITNIPTVINSVSENLKIYPNPNLNKLNVSIPNKNNDFYTIKIFNAEGTLVYQNKTNSEKTSIDISNFASGTYFLTVSNKDKTFKGKFVVK